MRKDTKQISIFHALAPYKKPMALLVIIALGINGMNLILPKMISHAIDHFSRGNFNAQKTSLWFIVVISIIFILTYLQSILQTVASERVGRDFRQQLSAKISKQRYAKIQELTPAKLLTNLTSDIDSIKTFVAQAISSIVASVVTIIGASILLLTINWKLALAVLAIVPLIGGVFFFILSRVRKLFLQTREVIDWLNKVINESILGAALIRVLHSQQPEYEKFIAANTKAKSIGLDILRLFAAMIPIITFVMNMATVIILALGGHFVISGTMSLGDFAAFNSYLSTLIFPIFVIGFMSNVIAQATASYGRIVAVLTAQEQPDTGTLTTELQGDIAFQHVSVAYGEKYALKDVSFHVKAGTKTAIIGPTAGGKTQLLYLLTGLIDPQQGTVEYDGQLITAYEAAALRKQVGVVFQDSIIFRLSIRENIAFSESVTETDLQKAIETAELKDFIAALPQGLETEVSERGTSLSGGQKQRIMLARALALNPKILLLDDFTARVDRQTEKKILKNIERNYPHLTLVSVTQKVASIEHYDQIVVLMEGEVLGTGTHTELMQKSPEYVQIYDSQQSTHTYE
ncbi:MAG: ABC transporter ATP-binding protein [Candidatus Kerfeldbacteria bacterium]|nr:ABC transporter ATP-binding protein [Candidatus Kerfeldbacteria bacterium]